MIHLDEKNVVICDREIRYANGLGENIVEREELAIKVHVCSDFKHVLELSKEKRIHIFIVDEQFAYTERAQIDANQIFVLARGKVTDLGEEEWAINKYQCADEIIREVFEFYTDRTKEDIMRTMNKERAKILAVYSPIHRIGKTRFAMALGKECAKRKKVLYLNLEEYSGFEEGRADELNLGDLLYYLKQGNGNLGIRLKSATRQVEDLSVISPIPVVMDLKEISWDEWKILMEQILENTPYEIVILDVGESIQGLFQLLEMSDRVYMPVLNDEVSVQKMQQYHNNLEQLNLERLKRITYQFVMPENIEEFAKIRMKEEC
jgi:cellulose biosynthesis protein BcsQ